MPDHPDIIEAERIGVPYPPRSETEECSYCLDEATDCVEAVCGHIVCGHCAISCHGCGEETICPACVVKDEEGNEYCDVDCMPESYKERKAG